MSELQNLDTCDDIERGGVATEPPELPKLPDVGTRAKLLADALPGVTTADRLPPRSRVLSEGGAKVPPFLVRAFRARDSKK